jgi:TATA-box binding protein (TBP) (component of TFIID and TFIIIB)
VTIKLRQGDFEPHEKLPPGVDSCEGRIILGAAPSFRLTASGSVGAPERVKHWYIHLSQGGAVIYHSASKTLQVITKGNNSFEPTMRKVLSIFFKNPKVESYRTTNMDGQMTLARRINMDVLGSFRLPHSVGSISDEPELFSGGIFVKWKNPKVTLIFFESGKVSIKGTFNLGSAVEVFMNLAQRIGPSLFKGRRGEETTRYEDRLNVRYPLAPNWAYTLQPNNNYPYSIKAGYYVRPGPNKKPRFYKIPNNPALVRPKVLKAYANVGVNVPLFVKSVLAIENNAGPSRTVRGPERAANWSSTKNGFYVKPGPGKLPYFYKIPVGKKSAKATVIKAYADAGVNIPSHVKNLFSIQNENTPKIRRHVIKGETINGKIYSRYTKSQLLQIARELNIANVGERNTLLKIFTRIKSVQKSASPKSPNMILNNIAYRFMNNGRVERDGRARMFSTLPKENQIKIAEGFIGKGSRLEHFKTLPRKDWYRTLLTIRNLRRQGFVSPRKSPSSVNSNYIRELERELNT